MKTPRQYAVPKLFGIFQECAGAFSNIANEMHGRRNYSFDNGPIIVACISSFVEQLLPSGGIIMSLSCQHPAQKNILFCRISVRVDLYVATPWRYAMHF